MHDNRLTGYRKWKVVLTVTNRQLASIITLAAVDPFYKTRLAYLAHPS